MKNSNSNIPVTKESLLQPKEPTFSEKVAEAFKSSSVLLVGIGGLFAWHFGVIWSGVDDFILPGPLAVFEGINLQVFSYMLLILPL